MNRSAINIYVQVFMWSSCAFSFLEHVPWNGITASEGKSMFTCLKNRQIVFKCGCPILYSHQHCTKIPMSLRFCLLIITILVATWCRELTHLKRPWCWERLRAGGEGSDRGWDGWMSSLTQWTWVWVDSGSWWGTGRAGVPRFMVSQRVGHDWATELNWNELSGCEVVSLCGSHLHLNND